MKRAWQAAMPCDHAEGNRASFPSLGKGLDHVEFSHRKQWKILRIALHTVIIQTNYNYALLESLLFSCVK